MKAAIYARVSTRDQSAEMQIRELEEYCTKRQWGIVRPSPIAAPTAVKGLAWFLPAGSVAYRDVCSGAAKSRPALDQLMRDARGRKFDVVVVYRYDRFARSLHHLVAALEEFRALGIDFVSLHESLDTTTPNGRLVFGIMASIAEFERELIRERIRSGIAARRARGGKFGRPSILSAELRDKISAGRAQGRSWRALSHETGVSPRSLRRAAQVPGERFQVSG
jgi:DNA invertase Pin-like site-specific DNA recombinase